MFVNGRSRPVIMEDMRRRIARGDITQERSEAIKVRAHVLRPDELIDMDLRQCVTSQQIVLLNFKRHKYAANDIPMFPPSQILMPIPYIFYDSETARRT